MLPTQLKNMLLYINFINKFLLLQGYGVSYQNILDTRPRRTWFDKACSVQDKTFLYGTIGQVTE